jgi:hypothetical protein
MPTFLAISCLLFSEPAPTELWYRLLWRHRNNHVKGEREYFDWKYSPSLYRDGRMGVISMEVARPPVMSSAMHLPTMGESLKPWPLKPQAT